MAKHPSDTIHHVDHRSLKRRVCRRAPGIVSYPVQYCNDLADYDIWHQMFLFGYCNNITTHNFEHPPEHVLDLGCGSGFWVVEAARKWTNSTIVGYDYVKMQPRLTSMPHLSSIASRVRWVHGNFLDGLAFPDAHFDFVRIAGLALAVPEDEWQKLFEEVYRVLKPGGIVEVIEDDLLFPCTSSMLQPPRTKSKGTSPAHRSFEPIHHATSTPSLNDTYNSGRLTSFLPMPYNLTMSGSSTPTLVSTDTTEETEHPQDHSRLKRSWEAMLASRFLSPKVISVLPFYLTSAGFDTLTSLPQLTIPLPPSSGLVSNNNAAALSGLRSVRSADSLIHPPSQPFGRLRLPSAILDFGPPLSPSPSPSRSPSPSPIGRSTTNGSARKSLPSRANVPPASSQDPAWSAMHLAKVVSTIRGCKEAIWREYNAEHDVEESRYLLSLTAPEEDTDGKPAKYIERQAFEVDWMNWELDMQDRMNMRRVICSNTPWQQPSDDSDRPGRKWREKLGGSNKGNNSPTSPIFQPRSRHSIAPYNPEDVCRSLRAFSARKPLTPS